MADFDFSEFAALASDFEDAAAELQPNSVKAMGVTLNKTKKTWQEKLAGSSTLPGLPRALSYDIEEAAGEIVGELGFDKSRGQGALGNVSEFGTPTVAPRGFGLASQEETLADFVRGQEIALDQALKKLGG
jgi:hypothetical protein